jgi:8-oxo-dGTP pyrophosphatase MutT (NUDIX family)
MRAFGDATRRNIAEACASFARLPDAAEPSALKRAAVVFALTESNDGDDTAFLLTKRASDLRAHRGQWALPGGRCDAG